MKKIIILLFTCNLINAQNLTIADYEKTEVYIKTRDNLELYTAIYQPKNTKKEYPILVTRTPYGCAPYGKEMPGEIMYNELLVKEGYIFVWQDIRARMMSDGTEMVNLMPVYSQKGQRKTDESTDAYDTFEWLIKHVKNNNGRIGIYGHSYRGWTSLMGTLSHHPALKAAQIAVPCLSDYFEDFTRYGLFSLGYTPIIDWFGTPKHERTPFPWWQRKLEYFSFYENYMNKLDKDNYDFFLKKGSLKNYGELLSDKNYFWNYLKAHPDYDEARKERNVIQYIKNINCPILLVGGWNDEQNLYGTIKSYEAISENNTSTTNYIMGPWTHGDHMHGDSLMYVGNIFYGKHINAFYYQKEFDFFEHLLKDKVAEPSPKLLFFDTGKKSWDTYEKKPSTSQREFYLHENESLETELKGNPAVFFEYISDPAKPVPYVESDNFNLFVSKSFMTDDQRFAYKRPDVLTFSTDVVTEDITMSGAITALLKFATNRQDADIIVKLIDVLPMDRKPENTDKPMIKMNGYQQMVRCGYIRGRYRESFSTPKPFQPDTVSDVSVELLDIHHTFLKGHQIMIQIQSSLFPLFDRNPQNYVQNIFDANDSDFIKANHRIYKGSRISFQVLLK